MNHKGTLILGGGGFVGRSLAARLRNSKKKCFSISRSTSKIDIEHMKDVHIASIDNRNVLKQLLPNCNTVVHVASDTTPGVSALQPSLEVTSNCLPTLKLLEVLQEYKNILLIYVSTGGAIYGDIKNGHATEEMPLRPLSYYGAGKAAVEKFILAYSKQTGNKAIILRPSNFYGPGQFYRPGFGIIPTLFHHSLNKKTLEVWGEGENIRDYLYIDDFIDCCEKIIDSNEKIESSEIYNIGSGRGTSLKELCLMVEEITGMELLTENRPIRPVDVKQIILESQKLNDDFSWMAKTNLHQGLKKSWEWYQRTHKTI